MKIIKICVLSQLLRDFKISILLCGLLLSGMYLNAQNGHIVHRKKINLLEQNEIAERYRDGDAWRDYFMYLDSVEIEKITYMSDGLKVKGYLVYPKKPGHYPGIVYNRGGNKEFGKLTERKTAAYLAKVASWGYVVLASQYRGNDGGEGREEFGGRDVNDVLNIMHTFNEIDRVDTSRLGIYGWSRGGMMTYLTLTKTNRFKVAAVGGGLSDLWMMMDTRKDTFETVYDKNIMHYRENKKTSLDSRSAIKQVDKICKTTPILMLHGTADWRVVPDMALDLSKAFIHADIPHRLVMFEGGDHGLSQHWDEINPMMKRWLGRYLKLKIKN